MRRLRVVRVVMGVVVGGVVVVGGASLERDQSKTRGSKRKLGRKTEDPARTPPHTHTQSGEVLVNSERAVLFLSFV